MPGRVSVAPSRRQRGERQRHVQPEREVRNQTPSPVKDDHEEADEAEAGDTRHRSHPDCVAAQIGAHGALFDDLQRDRQGARP